jgi:hypothetical protein
MHRSSENIGTIAAALAKAQLELTNPAKSLVGTLPGMTPNGDRSFRYAPLSSGLDLVRKSLGRHEIATVQTTAIDDTAGIVRLTTVLAHASGEWISSEWPVCGVSETGVPQRMGAALTYARRHSLFALVGIAGEDDLDAPDLSESKLSDPAGGGVQSGAYENAAPTDMNGKASSPPRWVPKDKKPHPSVRPSPLPGNESADARDRILAELRTLAGADDLAEWAHRILPQKNALVQEDARIVEQAFEERLFALTSPAGPDANDLALTGSAPTEHPAGEPAELAIPKTRRRRSKKHLEFVGTQPCLACGRSPSDAHHLGFTQPRALGKQVSDEFTVPLCRIHHRMLHDRGDERAWWQEIEIDPTPIAEQLWKETHSIRSTTTFEASSAQTKSNSGY